MRKLLVLVVALAMVMAMAVPTFAGEKYGSGWTKIHNVELDSVESSIFVYGSDGDYYGSFVRNPKGGGQTYGGLQLVGYCLAGDVTIKTVKGTYTAKLVEHGNGNAQNNPWVATDNYWIENLKEETDEPPFEPPIEETYNLVYEENTEDIVTDMPQNSTKLFNGVVDLSKQKPERDGYDFQGWGATPESKTPISQVTIENQHVWVYAIWEKEKPGKTYTLAYDKNLPEGVDKNIEIKNWPNPDTIAELENGTEKNLAGLAGYPPAMEGYKFKGWSKEADGQPGVQEIEIKGADVTVYAIWEKINNLEEPVITHTLTYDKNLAIEVLNMPGQESLENGSALLSTKEPIAAGYKFKGWSATSNGTTPSVQIEIKDADVTVYGIWEKTEVPPTPPTPPTPPVIVPPEDDNPGNTESPIPPVVVPPEGDDPGNNESPEPPVVMPPEGDDHGNAESSEPLDEGSDDPKTDTNQPKTDDNSNLMLYVLMTLSAMGALHVIWGKKKEEK